MSTPKRLALTIGSESGVDHHTPGAITGERCAALLACPIAGGYEQRPGDTAATKFSNHIESFDLPNSGTNERRQVSTYREFGESDDLAIGVPCHEDRGRLVQRSGEKRSYFRSVVGAAAWPKVAS
jgi:hypothetical protein